VRLQVLLVGICVSARDLIIASWTSCFLLSTLKITTIMPKVTLDNVSLAESNDTVVVENNHYFPPGSLAEGRFTDSDTKTVCPWKGTASYYNITLPDGKVIPDGAWYYPNPKDAAKNIKDYVAFYKNKVTIQV